jgi:hypothetical protein
LSILRYPRSIRENITLPYYLDRLFMTSTNFSIDHSCALIFEGNYLDAHNNFNFIDFGYNHTEKIAVVNFKKSNGEWANNEILPGFKIYFENVTSVYTKDHSQDYPLEYIQQDGRTIDLLGFSYDNNENMEGVAVDNIQSDLPSFIFVFLTGKAIKITAQKAHIRID